jgi:hypothetical protein
MVERSWPACSGVLAEHGTENWHAVLSLRRSSGKLSGDAIASGSRGSISQRSSRDKGSSESGQCQAEMDGLLVSKEEKSPGGDS